MGIDVDRAVARGERIRAARGEVHPAAPEAPEAAEAAAPPTAREVLKKSADQALDAAYEAARELVAEFEREDGFDVDVLKGHLLDIHDAIGQCEGIGDALFALTEAGVVPREEP